MERLALALAVTFAASLTASAAPPRDLADTAIEDGRFKTLVAAAKAAGLVETLKSDGPFTLFAPTDEAFAALPEGTVASLLAPANREALRRVLANHLVEGRVTSADLLPAPRAKSLAGESLTFRLRVGDANVVEADISCANGVIYVIDRVLVPATPVSAAVERISAAIERGVPLYNGGDEAACAAVYERAARDLTALPGALGEMQVDDIAAVLAAPAADASARAWALREAFDRILADAAFVPRIEAPMPEGFPAPGAVRRITEKTYPAYRAARAQGGNSFWTLFNHIKKNEIAMTAPVEMTMDASTADEGLRMLDQAFLYERPTLGEAGTSGKVEVVDLPAVTVLSVGMRGDASAAEIARARAALEARLSKDGFERAGPFRMLGYNSPMVPSARRFWELEVPVRRAAAK